jgi:hypothetical protein
MHSKNPLILKKNEAGIYLPVLAIVMFGIMLIGLSYGYDRVRERRLLAGVQNEVDGVCFETVSQTAPMLQRQLVAYFRDQVMLQLRPNLHRRGMKLMEARILAPIVEWDAFLNGGGPIKFGSFPNMYPCRLDNKGNDCMYLRQPDAQALATFPEGLFSAGSNADRSGATVGCEVAVEYTGVWGAKHLIHLISVEHLPLRGSTHRPGFYQDNVLTIAVAPEMPTSARLDRFRFPYSWNYDDVSFWDANYLMRSVDPRRAETSGAWKYSWQSPGFYVPFNAVPSGWSWHYHAGFQPFIWNYEIPKLTSASVQDELAVGCMNPAIMIRNLLVQTVVELATRDGEITSPSTGGAGPRLEFLVVNPRHMNNDTTALADRNKATLVRGLGQPVLIDAQYGHLPYVFYKLPDSPASAYTSTTVNAPYLDGFTRNPKFKAFLGEFTQPARNDFLQDYYLDEIRANQLRYCMQIYTGTPWAPGSGIINGWANIPLSPGVSKWKPGGLPGVSFMPTPGQTGEPATADFFSPNDTFEKHAVYGQNPFAQDYVDNAQIRSGVGPWAPQGDPWGVSTESVYLRELVGVLGAVQFCPVELLKSAGPACQKVGPPYTGTLSSFRAAFDSETMPLALRTPPDIVGFLQYINGTESAYASPGYFPLNYNGAGTIANIKKPFENDVPMTLGGLPPLSDNYYYGKTEVTGLPCSSYGGHVLLVLHQAPNSSTEADAIRAEILTVASCRRITVVFIPTSMRDISKNSLELLFRAYGPLVAGENVNFAPALVVFSPSNFDDITLTADGQAFRFGVKVTLPSEAQFRNYWRYLLDVRNNAWGNIVSESKDLFLKRILGRESLG